MQAVAKNLKLDDALGISTSLESHNGFPLSLDSAKAKSFKLSSIKSAILLSNLNLVSVDVLDQPANAFLQHL